MKIFGVDAETDGLYGRVWAIGAVVLNEKGYEIDRFEGQAETHTLRNTFVINDIVPVTAHLPYYRTTRELRDAFWQFWMKHRHNAHCVANSLFPVESGLFRKLYEDDPFNRRTLGPNPLHEVQTALLMARITTQGESLLVPGLEHVVKHNPVDDALVAARVLHHCMERMRDLST